MGFTNRPKGWMLALGVLLVAALLLGPAAQASGEDVRKQGATATSAKKAEAKTLAQAAEPSEDSDDESDDESSDDESDDAAAQPSFGVTLSQAGLNQGIDYYFNSAYAIPAYECWLLGFILPIPVCYVRTNPCLRALLWISAR